MRGRRGWVVTVVLVCTVAAGCDGGAEVCFDAPTAMHRVRVYDLVMPAVGIAGAEGCLLVDGAACGCRVTDENGEVDYPVPVGVEFMSRVSANAYLSTYGFGYNVYGDGYLATFPMISELLAGTYSIYFETEVDLDLGVAAVWALPSPGESLEGTSLQLLDASREPVGEAHGPFYGDGHRPVPDAEASLGPMALAYFVNLPPGTYFARAIGADGTDLYARCDEAGGGWERDLEGDLVLEIQVFGRGLSIASRFSCTP
jgi:hypothetical protein